jgi:hypothetical protein
MTEKLKEYITVPHWVSGIFLTVIISLFTTGWIRLDALDKEVVVEQTSRKYIEKKLEEIICRLDRIETKLEKK